MGCSGVGALQPGGIEKGVSRLEAPLSILSRPRAADGHVPGQDKDRRGARSLASQRAISPSARRARPLRSGRAGRCQMLSSGANGRAAPPPWARHARGGRGDPGHSPLRPLSRAPKPAFPPLLPGGPPSRSPQPPPLPARPRCPLKRGWGGAPSPTGSPGSPGPRLAARAPPPPDRELQPPRHWLRGSASLYISPGALEWSCIKRASGVGAGGARRKASPGPGLRSWKGGASERAPALRRPRQRG
ncbi:collagen alpha-1(I) chain-like [Suncus etruscus]|uniref:collagen alpha-1(I) chain-like n=1 Tax=Suncus etruscus TaxID=109475 RepID=UPI0021101CF2|nr:collagen alpha-1(I) chain-like [Suncus etruscus]